MCCARLAANAGPKKIAKNSPSEHHAQLCRAISSQLRDVSTAGKNSVSPTCPRNMVNFGPPAAEICWRVWGTPANFNRFRVLAALLHGTSSGRQRDFAALNRGRHLYSAGRPLRWALAHIPVEEINSTL